MVLAGTVPFPPDAFDPATVIEKYGAAELKTDADNVSMLLLAHGGTCIQVFTHRARIAAACET